MTRFLDSSDPIAPAPNLDPTVKQRLLRHLDSCISELDLDFHLASVNPPSPSPRPIKAEADSEARPDSSTAPSGGDDNNNTDTHIDGNRSRDGGVDCRGMIKMERLGLGACGVVEMGGGGDMLGQSCLVSASASPSLEEVAKGNPTGNPLLSVVQVSYTETTGTYFFLSLFLSFFHYSFTHNSTYSMLYEINSENDPFHHNLASVR